MGIFSGLKKIARAGTHVALQGVRQTSTAAPLISRIPGPVGMVGKVLTGGAIALSAYDLLKGNSGGGPNLDLAGGQKYGLPPIPGTGGFPGKAQAGDRSIFRDDPNIVAALQPWAIPARGLRASYRAPKGFVVRYDSAGDPYGIPKSLARAYLGWRPSKKPPISVGEWQAVKKADRTIKKMRKITSTMTTVDRGIRGGKVVVRRRKKKEG